MTRFRVIRMRRAVLRRDLRRAHDASVAVELAVIGTFVAFLGIGAGDFGTALWESLEVGNAARAGAEYATLHAWNSSAIQSAASSATGLAVTATPSTFCGCAVSGSITHVACGSTCATGYQAGTYVSVTATATYTPVMAVLWGATSITLSATSVTRSS